MQKFGAKSQKLTEISRFQKEARRAENANASVRKSAF